MAMDFSKPIGPLPTGAWIAVVAGGLGLMYYQRNHQSATPVDPTTLADAVGAGPTAFTAVNPSSSPVSNTPSFTDNATWAVAAITWAIAHGYQPTVADSAVRNYIQGTPPSSPQESAIIDVILKALGPPPETLPPPQTPPPVIKPPVIPPPVVKPPVKPPAPVPKPVPTPGSTGRWFVVTPWPTRDSTLSGIAQDAYGNAAQWPTLFNANRVGVTRPDGSPGMISNPDLIFANAKIWAPNAH